MLIWIAILVVLVAPISRAAEPTKKGPDIKEISKKLDNPFSDLWLLYFENEVGFYRGFPARETKVINTFLLNPVLSFPLPGKWTLLTRPAVPIITAPTPQLTGNFGRFPDQLPTGDFDDLLDSVKTDGQTELGDIGLPINFAPPLFDIPGLKGQGFAAAGVMLMFPTASDDFFGSEKFSMGPAGALGYLGEKWVFGLSLQHGNDVAGDDDAPDVESTSIQYFIS